MAKLSIKGDKRCERIAFLTTATVRENMSKVAMVNRSSVNKLINDAVAKYLEEHQNDIQRYNDFFGEE